MKFHNKGWHAVNPINTPLCLTDLFPTDFFWMMSDEKWTIYMKFCFIFLGKTVAEIIVMHWDSFKVKALRKPSSVQFKHVIWWQSR